MDSAAIDLQHQFYDMLMQSQYWSAERMRDYQRSQLTQLLRHARKNVPFYENRLDVVFRPNGEIDWDRWGEIPIVKRQDLVDHREAMQARELPPGHGTRSHQMTSGSTGPQATVTVNGLVGLARGACLYRVHTWHGVDWSQNIVTRKGDDPQVNSWPKGALIGRWGPAWDRRSSGAFHLVNRSTSLEQLLEFISRNEARYLAMGPKPAVTLALEALRLGSNVTIDTVFCHGEGVGPDEKNVLAEMLGARTIELYSSKEGAAIAHPCELGTGLHANAETLLLEVLDSDGNHCAPGVSGRVVITPFFNTAQPLVRYDQGDVATLADPCVCGRCGPLLSKVEGRATVLFFHPDGRAVARTLPEECRRTLGAGLWQIAQTGPTDFEIRYVPLNWKLLGDEESVSRAFKEHYFSDATVIFRRMTEIPLTVAEKRAEYVNEWRTASPAGH